MWGGVGGTQRTTGDPVKRAGLPKGRPHPRQPLAGGTADREFAETGRLAESLATAQVRVGARAGASGAVPAMSSCPVVAP